MNTQSVRHGRQNSPKFPDSLTTFSVATPGVKTCHKICGILNFPPNWSHAREMLGTLQQNKQRWLVVDGIELSFAFYFGNRAVAD
jgi:hypothetical protein